MMEKAKIKSCPFCGGKAKNGTEEYGNDYYKVVECKKCGASSGWYDTDNEAIAAWNKRTKEKA
jgi:Lar family restriction alleviation protein